MKAPLTSQSNKLILRRGQFHGNSLTAPLHLRPVGPLRRRPLPVPASPRAALWTLPDYLSDALQIGILGGIVGSITLSFLPILTGDSKERNERRFLQPDLEESADNVKWGVMSALTLLPFLNPMAWVFGALDDEESSLLYWSFAALYTLPYIRNGFELDGFAIATLLLGVVHLQVERIAQTEPAEVELPDVLRRVLRALPRAVTALGRYSAGVGEEVSDRLKRSNEARKGRPDRKYLEEKSREARMELEEFDRKRRQREREERQRDERRR